MPALSSSIDTIPLKTGLSGGFRSCKRAVNWRMLKAVEFDSPAKSLGVSGDAMAGC